MSKQNKGYKFIMCPNKQQTIFFDKNFGCVRFIYNNLLHDKSEYYKEHKKTLKREVSYYKAKEEYAFLKEVDSLALANAKINLDKAFKNFFEKRTAYPTFKKKGIHDSYTTNNQNGTIKIVDGYIKLPKVGLVKLKQHRLIRDNEKIKSATITKEAGKYYVSIIVEYEENIESIDKNDITINDAIGIDYSSTNLYVDSNGNCACYPKYYRASEKKLTKAQRKLSKMKQGSNNYKKQKLKLQKIHSRIANQRKDFLHKLSNQITNDYKLICFEDLNLSNIKRCLKLGKATSDNGFGMFRTFCEYKALKKGGYTIKIDKWFASTKTCNHCGYKNDAITLSTKEWVCPNCGALNLRDPNAALNIRDEGYRVFLAS